MKKLFTLFALLLVFNNASAQNDSLKKPIPTVYHGILVSKTAYFNGYNAGYYLDIHLRKRLWLFTDYSLMYASSRGGGPVEWRALTLYSTYKFAFRLNKEDARFTYYPMVGFSFTPFGFNRDINNNSSEFNLSLYASVLIGVEAKMRISPRLNLGLGVSYDLNEGGMINLKFGWNKYKKEKAN